MEGMQKDQPETASSLGDRGSTQGRNHVPGKNSVLYMCHSHLFTQQEASPSQQRAPVKSVVYNTPYSRMTPFMINMIVELYRTDLECYAHKMLPRFYMKKSFNDRADSALLYLMRQCPYIHTLVQAYMHNVGTFCSFGRFFCSDLS